MPFAHAHAAAKCKFDGMRYARSILHLRTTSGVGVNWTRIFNGQYTWPVTEYLDPRNIRSPGTNISKLGVKQKIPLEILDPPREYVVLGLFRGAGHAKAVQLAASAEPPQVTHLFTLIYPYTTMSRTLLRRKRRFGLLRRSTVATSTSHGRWHLSSSTKHSGLQGISEFSTVSFEGGSKHLDGRSQHLDGRSQHLDGRSLHQHIKRSGAEGCNLRS